MTVATAHGSVNSLFYSAASTIIRYCFIRTSLQPDVQEVLKRDAFVFKSVFIVESLSAYNLLTFFLIQRGKEEQKKVQFFCIKAASIPGSRPFPFLSSK